MSHARRACNAVSILRISQRSLLSGFLFTLHAVYVRRCISWPQKFTFKMFLLRARPGQAPCKRAQTQHESTARRMQHFVHGPPLARAVEPCGIWAGCRQGGSKSVIFQKSANWCEPTVFPYEQCHRECVGNTQIAQSHGARARGTSILTHEVSCGAGLCTGARFGEVRGPRGTRWCGGARGAEWAQWPSTQRPGPAGPIRGLHPLASHAARTQPGPATDRLPDLEIFAFRGLEAES